MPKLYTVLIPVYPIISAEYSTRMLKTSFVLTCKVIHKIHYMNNVTNIIKGMDIIRTYALVSVPDHTKVLNIANICSGNVLHDLLS